MENQNKILKVAIEGMTCQSCEITIERQFKKVAGVRKVEVNAAKGVARLICDCDCDVTVPELQAAIVSHGYKVKPWAGPVASPLSARPGFWQLVGLFALVLLLGSILSKLGVLKPNAALGSATSFGAIFLLGLVAASSSCLAVAGGLMLSSTAKFNERYGSLSGPARMKPVIMFVAGRAIGYGLLGGLIGLIGKALTPSPLVTGVIAIIAALYMLIMGLDMLQLAPSWLKRLRPRSPKALGHRVLSAEDKTHPAAPLLLGAATFFLPCGFTQALQLYALTTGSFLTSATILFAFALGTAPALLALGWASGSLKGRAGQWFFSFSGALVIVLGLWNIQNGLTIAGYPLSLPSFSSQATAADANDPNVSFDGQKQVVKMKVIPGSYSPNSFILRVGVPTRWEVDGTEAAGCQTVLQAPQLAVRELIKSGPNVIEFTPTKTGTFVFSCGMGMFRGQIKVVPTS